MMLNIKGTCRPNAAKVHFFVGLVAKQSSGIFNQECVNLFVLYYSRLRQWYLAASSGEIIKTYNLAKSQKIEEAPYSNDQLEERLRFLREKMRADALKRLLDRILEHPELGRAYRTAPAAMKIHRTLSPVTTGGMSGSPRAAPSVWRRLVHYADALEADSWQFRRAKTDHPEEDLSPYNRALERYLYLE